MPLAKPLTEVVAEVLSRKVAAPLRTVHKPVPLDNEPAKVVVLEQMFWSRPAEMTAGEPTVMLTVSRIARQPADVTVQISWLMPLAKPLTEVVAEVLSRNVAVPLRTVHKPLPLDNEPANVVVLAQMFWSVPAEMIAGDPTVMLTVSRISGQPTELTVQMSWLMPLAKPLTEVVAEVLSRNVAVPLRTVHKPLPLDNEPAKVVVLAQMFWSVPAEMIAGDPTVMLTVSRISGQPTELTVQMSWLMPLAKPLIDVVAEVLSRKVAAPLRTVHKPLPLDNEPANVVVLAQMFWSVPAEMIAGDPTVMLTVSRISGQPTELTVQMSWLMPLAKPLIDVVAEVLSRNVAVPLRTVHKPLPLDNEPAKVVVLAQMF
jgi:hypothetical protein